MDLTDKIAALAQRISKQKDAIETEEATKTAFVMPFLAALGYDVFDPLVVVPELTADVGMKKGEKVDYAIKRDGKVVLLIECKSCQARLNRQHVGQLYRYFGVTEARFGILTNGIQYWFYTDLDESNKMDQEPFFIFDLLNYRPPQVNELKKFSNTNFDESSITATASDLKYGALFMREIAAEVNSPSEDFCKLLISRIHQGKQTANVIARFTPLIHQAMRDTVRELVNQRLELAMDDSGRAPLPATTPPQEDAAGPAPETATDGIVTTDEEREGYQIVRAIVREVVSADRVHMRDAQSYCAILLDDNNRKPICRLHLNRGVKYIGLFNEEKKEERIQINSLDDIFIHAEALKQAIRRYIAT